MSDAMRARAARARPDPAGCVRGVIAPIARAHHDQLLPRRRGVKAGDEASRHQRLPLPRRRGVKIAFGGGGRRRTRPAASLGCGGRRRRPVCAPPSEVPHRHPLRHDAPHRHTARSPQSRVVRWRLACRDAFDLLGPLSCAWTTWFTKYGGPTELKWSNRTKVVQPASRNHLNALRPASPANPAPSISTAISHRPPRAPGASPSP